MEKNRFPWKKKCVPHTYGWVCLSQIELTQCAFRRAKLQSTQCLCCTTTHHSSSPEKGEKSTSTIETQYTINVRTCKTIEIAYTEKQQHSAREILMNEI